MANNVLLFDCLLPDLGGGRFGENEQAAVRPADVVVEEIRKMGGTAVANYNSVLDGDKVIETAIKSFGRIDILINNAGILRDKSFQRMSDQDWKLIQEVHAKGVYKCARAAWPYFIKQRFGRLINTASSVGLYGNFGEGFAGLFHGFVLNRPDHHRTSQLLGCQAGNGRVEQRSCPGR